MPGEIDNRVTLTPFIELLDPEDWDNPGIIAGYRTEDGDAWGITVPLDFDMVIAAIRIVDTPRFEPILDRNGRVECHPVSESMSDDRYIQLLRANQPFAKPVDDLVADYLKCDRNEPDHGEYGVLDDYRKLSERLARALELVDAEIKRRSDNDT